MSPSSTSDSNFTTHSTLSCEQASVATSNSNILDPLRPNYLPQPLDRKINKCFLALRPQRYMLRPKSNHLRDMLGPNVLYSGPRLEVHRGMKLRINGNRLCKLYESRIFRLFTTMGTSEAPRAPYNVPAG